jgi:hypothetical protein
MSTFPFDFDLEDDLDESFDAISLQDSAKDRASAVVPPPSVLPECRVAPSEELPMEEIPLSTLVRCPALSPPCFLIYASGRRRKA